MSARSEAVALIRAHLVAATALLTALEAAEAANETGTEGEDLKCPKCSEDREERLEDTSYAGDGGKLILRVTCKTCGVSFAPCEEVQRG